MYNIIDDISQSLPQRMGSHLTHGAGLKDAQVLHPWIRNIQNLALRVLTTLLVKVHSCRPLTTVKNPAFFTYIRVKMDVFTVIHKNRQDTQKQILIQGNNTQLF